MQNLDGYFGITTKILFGKEFLPLNKYEEWLTRRLPRSKSYHSSLSDKQTHMHDYYFFRKIPNNKIAAFEDREVAAEKRIKLSEEDSLRTVVKKIKDIGYFIPDFVEGRNINVSNTTVYLDCINLDKSFDIFTTKNSAYLFSTLECEGLFGCYRVATAKFCIHCYNVMNLNSCFEVDNAKNCSNSMFCHNVENIHDSLFCFNVKSKRYAVGNIEVGKEKYLEIKKMLLDQIVPELEKNGKIDMDIYNVL